tara:strand:+ start:2360 stop:2641 length:282 start_codon:yes stop_codon:yes gene_type:complete
LTAGTRLFWLTEIATIRQEAAKLQLDHHLFLIILGAMIHKAPQPCEIADVKTIYLLSARRDSESGICKSGPSHAAVLVGQRFTQMMVVFEPTR